MDISEKRLKDELYTAARIYFNAMYMITVTSEEEVVEIDNVKNYITSGILGLTETLKEAAARQYDIKQHLDNK